MHDDLFCLGLSDLVVKGYLKTSYAYSEVQSNQDLNPGLIKVSLLNLGLTNSVEEVRLCTLQTKELCEHCL